jgi:hypothetical protein
MWFLPFSLRERHSVWISHPLYAFNMPRPSKYSLICSPNVHWSWPVTTNLLVGYFFKPRFVFFSEFRIFCSANFSEGRAGRRDVTCGPPASSSAVAVPTGTVWNLHELYVALCVFSRDSWLRFANMRPTGWVHAGKKGLGKYLESVYLKSFLLFFDTTLPTYKPSGSDIRVQIPLRTSVCHKLFLSYVFLHSNAIYRVSLKSPTSTCFSIWICVCSYHPQKTACI